MLAERYAANPRLTLQQIADEVGRTLSTVRTHYSKERWKDLRAKVQAQTIESVRAKLQRETERFAVERQRLTLKIARRALRAALANLGSPGSKDSFGSDRVDGFQLAALLKAHDDGTVAGKVAEQLTPILFEVMDRRATEQLTEAKLQEFRSRLSAAQPHGTNGTTSSTLKPTCANGRVASLFSRPNGTS